MEKSWILSNLKRDLSSLHKKILDFYHRDDASTTLPGKRDKEKVKRKGKLVQKQDLTA